uniref:YitH acetyltransferase (GNAT) domain-containing protein n=1 Tax=Ditylenchus dipsaci TaxID=166011 RepID=A0A915DWK8_9BILA
MWKYENFTTERDDYLCYLNGLGTENFQLLAVFKKGTKELIASVMSACVPCTNPSLSFCSIAHFFVLPDFRSAGIGSELFSKIMNSSKFSGKNLYLCSAPSMSQKYSQRYGFNKFPGWKQQMYKISINQIQKDEERVKKVANLVPLTSLNEDQWQQVLKYDREVVGGIKREAYMRLILSVKTSTAVVVMDQSDSVVGICNLRELTEPNTLMAGPFFADSSEIAETMIRQTVQLACHKKHYETLIFLLPSTHKAGVDLISRLGEGVVQKTDCYCPQFTQHVIEVAVNKIFSAADPDLLYI